MRAFGLVALAACAHAPPTAPPGCAKDAQCLDWYVEHVMAELAVVDYPDPALAAYVDRVGRRVAAAGGVTRPVRFRVIDDPEAQAETWTGGVIHVNRGALGVLRSEAELAALLGHELGHVIADHTEVHHLGTIRDAVDDEIQADEIAVRLVARAGYDPGAVELMMRAVSVDQPRACDPYVVHPCMPERLARIRALATGLPAGELGAGRYRAAVAGLFSGDDPYRVAVVGPGLVFAHAGLALAPPEAHDANAAAGRGALVFGQGGVVIVTPIAVELGRVLRDLQLDHSAFYVGDRGALWILVIDAPDAAGLARKLVAAVRPARPAELAGLTASHYQLTGPRVLWSAE